MANGNKTVVILTPGFPENEQDSTCLPAQQAFIRVVNRLYPGLQVIILAFQYPLIKKTYSWYGNTVICFGGNEKGMPARGRVWREAWTTLRRLKKQNDLIGILSFWCSECALVGKYFGKLNHLLHYCWILGQDARAGNKYVKWIKPAPGELVAMSDFLAAEFFRNYGTRPAHIIPNGVDSSQYQPSIAVRNIDVLGVGSLIPLKQYDVFIAIIAALRKRIPGLRAVICGDGPEINRLQELIRQEQLEDTLSLAGRQPHPEVLRLMQRSKILLHTSSYEGFSTVCLEALYAGAQVVSFVKPMMEWTRNWHIAGNREEAIQLLLEILEEPLAEYRPVLVYSMDESVKKIMQLFC